MINLTTEKLERYLSLLTEIEYTASKVVESESTETLKELISDISKELETRQTINNIIGDDE